MSRLAWEKIGWKRTKEMNFIRNFAAK